MAEDDDFDVGAWVEVRFLQQFEIRVFGFFEIWFWVSGFWVFWFRVFSFFGILV